MLKKEYGPAYVLGPCLAKGGSARVYDVQLQNGGCVVAKAVQRMNQRLVENEVKVYETIGMHSNVATLHTVLRSIDTGVMAMVLSRPPGRDLLEFLAASKVPLGDNDACRMGHGVASGLAHLHSYAIVHSDVKIDNILWDHSQKHATLIDFGLARYVDSNDSCEAHPPYGTLGWRSPEVLGCGPVVEKSDVFGLGLCVFTACTGTMITNPSMDCSKEEIEHNTRYLDFGIGGRRWLHSQLRSLVELMLSRAPADRPTADQVIIHLGP